MTEGSTRTKRMGTRFFKNPPQPHMCIQDFLRGSVHPCYINVLSWDKIAMASCPFERLSLYGGMKINPPRTEKPEVNVFFVMANPEVLRKKGKYAHDLKEQSILIELLLNFIEAMNKGVEFMRQYKILNDRDITGELKEIWMVVQSDNARAQSDPTSEEVKRPVPQYPLYSEQEQQQQQKKQHQQQQYRPPPPQTQQLQHQIQQIRQTHSEDSHQQIQPQPPQYHSNYSMQSRGPVKTSENYDLTYVRQPQQNITMPQNDNIYQPWSTSLQYANRVRRMEQKIGSREAREFLASNVSVNSSPQQHSMSYPASQYQYQLLRQVGPAYNGPKVHPNASALTCSTVTTSSGINPGISPGSQMHYDHYYLPMRLPEKNVCVKVHRVQQPQQPQLQLANPIHMAPVPPYEPIDPFYDPQMNSSFNWRRSFTSQNHTTQPKNNNNKRQFSPSHTSNNGPKENSEKSKSPIKVLQRDNSNNSSSNVDSINSEISMDKSDQEFDNTGNKKKIQVTDLDDDELQITPTCDNFEEIQSLDDIQTQKKIQESSSKNQVRTKILVPKRNKLSNDSKSILKNGNSVTNDIEIEQPGNIENILIEGKNEQINISESERNGFNNDKPIKSDSKVSKVINNCSSESVINADTSEDNNEQCESKVNGQGYNLNKSDEQVYQVYTILRKSDVASTQDGLTNEITQMAIKDCTETSEMGAVPS
ncbi:hypothetical protein G9C98_003684 [Cotesia typhae]|uniref:Uncharacterized protein n=1 Tax=Cotesia typhae TaxID=2053667 RepID=A0A8J5UQR4_9HYME|nr:hypothetical protein G9C98_003684 [Cotesia typhae]